MNVLAHRLGSESPARRIHVPEVRLPAVRLPAVRLPELRMPRSVRVLGASVVATTVAMSVLQRVAERIG